MFLPSLSASAGTRTFWRSRLVTALYYLNPITIMTCASLSTSTLLNLCIIMSLSYGSSGSPFAAFFSLAIAVYWDLYPLLLLPAILLLLQLSHSKKSLPAQRRFRKGMILAVVFGAFVWMLMIYSSVLVMGEMGWQWIHHTYGFVFQVSTGVETVAKAQREVLMTHLRW